MRVSDSGRPFLSVLVGCLVAVTTACGGGEAQNASGDGPEMATITLGMLPLPEVAPIQIGIEKGFFKEEGLTVETQIIQGGAAAMPQLVSGQFDILHSNYVSAVLNAAQGTAKIKVVGDCYAGKPGNFLLMTPKKSPIRTLGDLKDKRIGVNTKRNVATLLIESALKLHDLTADDVTFVEAPFPNMAGTLEKGQVDAAFMPEPFTLAAEQQMGARTLQDLMEGPTADFPIAGYLATEEFTRQNPKTVTAFQQGLNKAVDLAVTERTQVDAVLPKYTKIDKEQAALMSLGGYSDSINTTRLQRVADFMHRFGYLDSKFDVSPLLLE